MTFDIEVGGRVRRVSVERAATAGGAYRVLVDGRTYLVDAVRVGQYGLSLIMGTATFSAPGTATFSESGTATFSGQENLGRISQAARLSEKVAATVSGQTVEKKVAVPDSVEVQVVPGTGPGEILVTMDGRIIPATLNGRRTRGAAETAAHMHGEQTVIAPMPGRVVRVLVGPGDAVTARQGVIVVEAMKMENELRATKPGRVREVNVEPGMSVDAGRVLMVIE
jgi:biotin carboxyl carrier protein